MRQIISTITPEQYGLITQRVEGALVVQGGPGTGKTAVGLHRAAWLLYADPQLGREGVLVVGPNRVFIAYISQVLPALGEQSVEQRPVDGLVSLRPWKVGEPEERATLLGSGRLAAVPARLLWGRVGPPAEPVEIPVGPAAVTVTPGDVAGAIAEARERRPAYQPARERFRERLADPRGHAGHDRVARRPGGGAGGGRLGRAADPGVPAAGQPLLAAGDARRAAGGAVQAAPAARGRGGRAAVAGRGRPAAGRPGAGAAGGHDALRVRAAGRGARADRARAAHLRARGGRRGAEPHAELLVSYRVPDDFVRIAATLHPDAAVPKGVRHAPRAAVALATPRVGEAVAGLAARMAADAGSVGVVAPAAARDAVAEALAAAGLVAGSPVDGLSGGVNLLSLADVKGLEFDDLPSSATRPAGRSTGAAEGISVARRRPVRHEHQEDPRAGPAGPPADLADAPAQPARHPRHPGRAALSRLSAGSASPGS